MSAGLSTAPTTGILDLDTGYKVGGVEISGGTRDMIVAIPPSYSDFTPLMMET